MCGVAECEILLVFFNSLIRQPGSSVVCRDRGDKEGIQRPSEGCGVSGLQ